MGKQSSNKEISWTPSIAYAVGLLATDGSLSIDRRHIALSSKDIDLLNTFKKCLEVQNKIGKNKNGQGKVCYRVQIGNVMLYKWLLSIGLFPNKTYTIGKLNIPDNYFVDFVRGHFDGDGTILSYTDKRGVYKDRRYINRRLYIRLISASRKHIIWLHNSIIRLSGIKGALIKRNFKSDNRVPIWEIKYAKQESLKFLKWMYYKKELPSLQRKLRATKVFLREQNRQTRKPYMRVTN